MADETDGCSGFWLHLLTVYAFNVYAYTVHFLREHPVEHKQSHGQTRRMGAVSGLVSQIDRLIDLGIHSAIGLSPEAFRQSLLPLGVHVQGEAGEPDMEAGTADAVIVINTPRLPIGDMWSRVHRAGKPAMERLFPRKPEDFRPTESLDLPAGEAYLLLGLDRGNATLNAVPTEAAQRIAAQGRAPLTVEEGTSVLLQWPLFLKPNHCFMMLGSRCGDRRVPAWWLSNRAPRLGWCWEGNPHTWLGFASCLGRSPAIDFGRVEADRDAKPCDQAPSRPEYSTFDRRASGTCMKGK